MNTQIAFFFSTANFTFRFHCPLIFFLTSMFLLLLPFDFVKELKIKKQQKTTEEPLFSRQIRHWNNTNIQFPFERMKQKKKRTGIKVRARNRITVRARLNIRGLSLFL